MSWRAHIAWREPAPAGTYADRPDGTRPLLDYAETLTGFADRESAYEAGRLVRTRLTQRGALEVDVSTSEQPRGRA